MQTDITRLWYQDKINALLPLSWLFGLCVTLRRFCYRAGIFKVTRVNAPVIVVGNITVGGTGKTPFTIWLADWLRTQGYKPGIVSRGLGGKASHRTPHRVNESDNAEFVGDEAILLTRQSQCPMVICANRAAAARELLAQTDCNIVISDDGLQHYGLARDVEIVMIDGERRFGNGCLLPAGPLREPVSRLDDVDMVVVNGGNESELTMQLELVAIKPLKQNCHPSEACHPRESGDPCSGSMLEMGPRFRGDDRLRRDGRPSGTTIHAIAAIGNPDRFFQALRRAGFAVIPHAFPDRYRYTPQDLTFNDDLPIVMTTKDAVKCEAFATDNMWLAEVTTKVDERIPTMLSRILSKKNIISCFLFF